MKKSLFFILLMFSATYTSAQQEIKPSIARMIGIWRFQDRTFISYMINKANKSIKINYWTDDKNASVHGTPFSYFGFYDGANRGYPKRLANLDSAGHRIFFYDDLGRDYDSLGNIVGHPTSLWVSYNEDEQPNHEPAVLRFYRTGTPGVYIRVQSIPDSILLTLKQNPQSWNNYAAFVGMLQKKVRAKQATLYQSPNIPSKAYLIAGDEIEVLETAKEWYRIRYYGKKVMEGWIRRIDID